MGFAMGNQMAQAMTPQQGGQGGAPAQGGAAPPPIPSGPKYFAAIDGQQAGPFDTAALKQQIEGGSVTRDTLVWTEGMANWATAGEVDAVAKLFGAAPPPLPPS